MEAQERRLRQMERQLATLKRINDSMQVTLRKRGTAG